MSNKRQLVCTGRSFCSSLSKIGKKIYDEYKEIYDEYENFGEETKNLLDAINTEFKKIKTDNFYISSVTHSGRKDLLFFVSHVEYASREMYDGILKVIVECEGKTAIAEQIVKNNICSLLKLCSNK